ncbi:hypothetical protein CEK71_15680 [Methylovulum psychrotolerans]|jgi:twitching motility protein PilI|uniref:CheW-like domain-containing protein n=2 Tax=Methylovulum psychrotolerans TaxID=1704499 RepID=A0A1Z4C1I0_9GAMM|nr:hypothetical protein CEK71_15680 [Methylovulum psychrotolerans]
MTLIMATNFNSTATAPIGYADTAPANPLGFRVGGLGFLLPAQGNCEVLGALPVNPIPKTAPWFSGLLNRRGTIVPVIDLHRLFDSTTHPPQKRHLLAIGHGDKTLSLWIDDYPQPVADIDEAPASPFALPDSVAPFIRQTYIQGGQTWLELDFEAFFNALGGLSFCPEAGL